MKNATNEEKAEIIAVIEEVKRITEMIPLMTKEQKRQAGRDIAHARTMIKTFRRLHPDD